MHLHFIGSSVYTKMGGQILMPCERRAQRRACTLMFVGKGISQEQFE